MVTNVLKTNDKSVFIYTECTDDLVFRSTCIREGINPNQTADKISQEHIVSFYGELNRTKKCMRSEGTNNSIAFQIEIPGQITKYSPNSPFELMAKAILRGQTLLRGLLPV